MNDYSGPAFPVNAEVFLKGPDGAMGMTLRQYYAGQAMMGLLSGLLADGSKIVETTHKTIAEQSVICADALLAELAKEE